MAVGFRSILVNCVRRSANNVARALARFAKLIENEIVWMEEDPLPATDALYLNSSLLKTKMTTKKKTFRINITINTNLEDVI